MGRRAYQRNLFNTFQQIIMNNLKFVFHIVVNIPYYLFIFFYGVIELYRIYRNKGDKSILDILDDISNNSLETAVRLEDYRFYINYSVWIILFYFMTTT